MTHIMNFFNFEHLPQHLAVVSERYYELALWINKNLPDCEEKNVALRKLLESKDCAVRSKVYENA